MNSQHWSSLRELLDRITDLDEEQREKVLQGCGDPRLQFQVRQILAYLHDAGSAVEPDLGSSSEQATVTQPYLRPGDFLLSRFEIVRVLGQGGMGQVYEAIDHTVKERLALKTVLPQLVSNQAALQRLRSELRRARHVSHSNICRVHEFFEAEDATGHKAFFTMELLEGETLGRRLQRAGRLDFKLGIKILTQMSQGLEAAHRVGILHRDLKPSNVFLVRQPNDLRVVITDFGLAYTLTNSSEQKHSTVVIGGTPGYMAPEQFSSDELTPATDVYALGIVAANMIHGTSVPQRAKLYHPLRYQRCHRAIVKATRADPKSRFQSATEFIEACGSRNYPRAALALSALVTVGLIAALWGTSKWKAIWREPGAPPELPIPFTSYPGYQRFPSFSPDGTRVAFTWERPGSAGPSIFLKVIDSDAVPLTSSSGDFGAAWSPDGRYIAFLRARDLFTSSIMTMSAVGGQEREVAFITRESWRVLGNWNWSLPAPFLAWSPDGKWLLSLDQSAHRAVSSIVRVSVETGEKRPVTEPPSPSRGDGSIALSPDGKTLAYTRTFGHSTSDIYVMPVTQDMRPGGTPRRLTSDGKEIFGLAWNPDRSRIVFSSARAGRRELWQVNTKNGELTRANIAADDPTDVAVSPVGQYLVYSHPIEDENIWRVPTLPKKLNMAGEFISSARREHAGRYSPDGKHIAFQSNRSGNEEVWICDADGSNARKLTRFENASSGSPRWSPDSREIAFDSDTSGNWEIYIISSNGGTARRITQNQANDIRPSWSRDGQWIYYSSEKSSRYEIFRISRGGTNELQLTKSGGIVAFESEDGKELYFTEGNKLKAIPINGGSERLLSANLLHNLFTPVRNGVYYFDRLESNSTSLALKFLNSRSGALKQIGLYPGPLGHDDLSMSPDGAWLLYDKMDRAGSETMLVKGYQ